MTGAIGWRRSMQSLVYKSFMHEPTIAFLMATALISFGCKPNGGGGDDKAAPTEKTTKPATVPAGGADWARSVDGEFCLTLPPGQKGQAPYDKDESSKAYEYSDDGGKGLTVVVTKMKAASDWDDEVASRSDEAKTATHKDPQVSELPGGGKLLSWVEPDGKTWVTVLVHKDMKRLFCRTQGKPADPALVDACKSLRPL